MLNVFHGEVLDVAVDLRQNSKTFGKHFKIILSSINKKQLFIPRGFAHGFLVLSEFALFSVINVIIFIIKNVKTGIIFNDPTLNIDWQETVWNLKLSEKDLLLPIL